MFLKKPQILKKSPILLLKFGNSEKNKKFEIWVFSTTEVLIFLLDPENSQ